MIAVDFQTRPFGPALKQLAPALAREFEKNFKRDIAPPFERLIDRILRAEPPRPDLPIRWTSPKQRRAVMRKLRMMGMAETGYVRTHQLARAWETEITLHGLFAELWVINMADMAQFVYGPFQQRYLHKWPVVGDVGEQIGNEVDDAVGELWLETTGTVLDDLLAA